MGRNERGTWLRAQFKSVCIAHFYVSVWHSDMLYVPTAFFPGVHPASCPVGVPGALSLRVKRPGRESDHLPPSSAEVFMAWCSVKKEAHELLYLYLCLEYVKLLWFLTCLVVLWCDEYGVLYQTALSSLFCGLQVRRKRLSVTDVCVAGLA
jgi:hypothetical protein